MSSECYYVGVDVGTGSVRAGVVDATGCVVGMCAEAIKLFNEQAEHYEQSSEDVW